MVAVAETPGTLQRGLGPATDDDRQRRPLRRERVEHEVIERVEAALERLGRARPEMPPELDRLVEIGAADVEPIGRAEVSELPQVPPDTDADDEPTARQRVERGQLFRQEDGVPLR